MAGPPAKKRLQRRNKPFFHLENTSFPPESASISMIVDDWKDGQVEQISPVHRVNGYPWRLLLKKGELYGEDYLWLICDKSDESELWKCNAMLRTTKTIKLDHAGAYEVVVHYMDSLTFISWKKDSWQQKFLSALTFKNCKWTVEISTKQAGESWRLRPPMSDSLDRTLVVGKEKKRIEVNKQSLASVSPFFDRLFNGDFKEKNMNEIPIEDVDYEEFSTMIRIVYDSSALTNENVLKTLELADRFELTIVEDKIANFLLPSKSFSVCQKLVIAEQYNQPVLKEILLTSKYSADQMKKLSNAPELDQLSVETVRAILKKCTSSLL